MEIRVYENACTSESFNRSACKRVFSRVRSLGAKFRLLPAHGVSAMQRSGSASRNLPLPRYWEDFSKKKMALFDLTRRGRFMAIHAPVSFCSRQQRLCMKYDTNLLGTLIIYRTRRIIILCRTVQCHFFTDNFVSQGNISFDIAGGKNLWVCKLQ